MLNPLEYQFTNTLKNYGYDVIVNGLDQVRILLKEYQERTSSSEYKYMLFRNGLIKQGDIVKIFDDNWLVLHEDISINDVYTKVIIRRLKFNINFNFLGEVIAFPSAIDTGTMNVSNSNIISIQDGRIVLTLQENETTKQIKLNQRFIVMGSAWKVIQKTNAEFGLYKIYADIDILNPNDDDMENEIADRWKYETKPKNIKTVGALNNITVEYATNINDIVLPSKVEVTLEDDSTSTLNVVWDKSTYNGEIAGLYNLVGNIVLIQGISNANKLKASINIIVNEYVELDNYTIAINNIETSLFVGDTLQLDITVTNNDEVVIVPLTYVSSDETILTVEDGLINAVGVGSATITIKVTDDETVFDTITLNIEEQEEGVFALEIIGQDSIMAMQSATYNIKTTYNNIVTGHEVTFEIADTSLATIESQDGRSCVVKTNTNFNMGETKLKATLNEDETVFVEKVIAITGL